MLNRRQEKGLVTLTGTSNELTAPQELIGSNYESKILGYELNKHYLAVLEEIEQRQTLKIQSLRSGRW